MQKINYDEISFFKADLSIFLMIYQKEHDIGHWREINKVIDDFIESWNEDPDKMHKWIGEQVL